MGNGQNSSEPRNLESSLEVSHHTFHIPSTAEGKTAASYLKGRVRKMTPMRLDVAFHKGMVRANGVIIGSEQSLHKGDIVEVDTTHFDQPKVFPENIPIRIVYEDADLLILQKPSGMACHAGLGVFYGTLLNALAWHFQESNQAGLKNGLIHRLDRGTSGLMLCAKTKSCYDGLMRQMRDGEIKRSYFVASASKSQAESGLVDAPLGRDPENPFNIGILEGGKEARTRYRWLEEKEGLHLYQCHTETGRTHQVRIHMASVGAALFGDQRYGGKEADRLYLCSASIGFKHPIDGSSWNVRMERPDFFQEQPEIIRD